MSTVPLEPEDWVDEERAAFWALVDTSAGPDKCWPWLGSTRASHGFVYGTLSHRGLQVYAHRVAFMLVNGSIDPTLTVDHSYAKGCRLKLCCNAGHMEQVTQSENTMRKFRDPERLYPLTCPSGHPKIFGHKTCKKCLVIKVAKAQAKRPDYYREIKRIHKRYQRARKKAAAN